MPALANITWERVEREDHVTYPVDGPYVPGRDVVFDQGFPRPGGLGKLVAAKYTPPDEMPDAEYRSSSRPAASSSIGTPAR